MILLPCNTCRLKATCELRAEKRRLLRGLRLTSARFTCQLQRDDMPPGAVVDARLEYTNQGEYDWEEGHRMPRQDPGVLRGIVMYWRRGKVLVYFPKQDGELSSGHSMAKLTPSCLTPTGVFARVCRYCGLPESAKPEKPDWVCRNRQDGDFAALECEYESAPASGEEDHAR